MDKYYIGIDIGLKGGIAIIKGSEVTYCSMPISNKFIDIIKLAVILKKYKDKEVHAIFEKLHGLPNQKLSVIWSLGRQVGIVETLLKVLKIPYTEVTPQSWQKEMFTGITVVFKNTKVKGKIKTKKDTKAMALTACKKIFPKETFLATQRSKVAHDGIVDAVLLAEYGRRRNL